MQAVILAGGLGTRLRPLTLTVPKPMVPVGGRPFLEYQIELLRRYGITRLLVLVGYLGEQIIEHFGDGRRFGVAMDYSEEPSPLGNGGALKFAFDKLDERFLLLYGDTYLPIDYGDFAARFERSRKKGMVVAYRYTDAADRGDDAPHNVLVDANGMITDYRPEGIEHEGAHVESGALALRKEIVTTLPTEHTTSLGSELFPGLIRERELAAYVTDRRFCDIGTPERLARAASFISRYV